MHGLRVLGLFSIVRCAYSWSCETAQEAGCYTDFTDGETRTLSGLGPVMPSDGTSPATCVDLCARIGFQLAGVEDHDQCFCGDAIHATATPRPAAECQVMNCSGNEDQMCGDVNRIRIFNATCTGYPEPNYWACTTDEARQFPYCNISLPHEDRLSDLLSRLTLEEKIAAISPQPELGGTCNVHSAGKNKE